MTKAGSTVKFYNEAKPRIPTHRERVLNALREAGVFGVTNIQLGKVSQRWQARLGELYNMGYSVNVESEGDGVCRYTLTYEPESPTSPKPKNAIDILEENVQQSNMNIDVEELRELLELLDFQVIRKAGYNKRHNKGA